MERVWRFDRYSEDGRWATCSLPDTRSDVSKGDKASSQMSYMDGMSPTTLRFDSFGTSQRPCDCGSS